MLNPQLFRKVDTDTPLRLSPKVFINKEDENYFLIGLYDKEQATKFVKHLITAVYAFSEFTRPADLISVWPQENVNDLLKVIITLRKEKLLVSEKEYYNIVDELTIKESQEEKSYIEDKNWHSKYIEAIKTIPAGSHVLYNGAKGGGYVAREITKNGVSKVTASITDLGNTTLAKYKAREEKIDNIDFVFSPEHKINPICYANKFNVYITELFEATIFENRVLETALYARKNLLEENAQFIPASFDLKVLAFESKVHRDLVQESKDFEILYEFSFNAFREALKYHMLAIESKMTKDDTRKLSEEHVVKNFDLATLKRPEFSEEFELKITEAGKICGFCAYFDLKLTEDINLSNSPFDAETRVIQKIFAPAGSIYVEPGDVLKLKATYDGKFKLSFVV